MTENIQRLVFVRHGESEHHVNGLTGGWTDTPLTPLGRKQVTNTAKLLAQMKLAVIGALFCSDLKRASESASIIAGALDHEPEPVPELREINNGDAAGLTMAEASRIERAIPEGSTPDWQPYPNAESWRQLYQRTQQALQKMDAEGHAEIVVVGHGLAGAALVNAWLQIPVESRVSFHFDTAAFTELRINEWQEREVAQHNVRA